MYKEKIYKRQDGTRLKLTIRLSVGNVINWSYSASVCQPKKRTFKNIIDRDCYTYRARDFPDGRNEYEREKVCEIVSQDEIDEVRSLILAEIGQQS